MCEHEHTSELLFQHKVTDYRGTRKYEVAVCDDCKMLVNYYNSEMAMTPDEIRRMFIDLRELLGNVENAHNDMQAALSAALNPFRDLD